jgi:tetratricopeptide (TPR) repeat protein
LTPPDRFNPFPGLRPFEPDEDHLFFGREKEIDELLRRLRTTRFLSVVGASGSGKSSLVRSGLIPSLQSGLMVSAGSTWRVAIMRPGEDPIGNLAGALDAPDALGVAGELGATNAVLIEATLRRSTLGLVAAVRQSRIPGADNLLLVVDQFEELFRFRRSGVVRNSRDESIQFVKLLVEAARQSDVPIYVVVTMRSDFIGDCMEYPGLAEAVSAGQYLVPRMSREELRSAIVGPVAVGGGTIAPRLVLRMLNDVGDDPDQLPVLQHALMRTWNQWERRAPAGEPIDLSDYEAVGTLKEALSRHAEEAFAECGPARARLAEQVFKALTDTFSDPRGVRRPTSIGELAAISEADEADVIALVEIFRQAGRSFLMPPAQTSLVPSTVVDLSHESLMRCWKRLIGWAEEERASAAFYARLSQATMWYEEASAGLWRNPELEFGLRWRSENRPTRAWALRYNDVFDRAMSFLDQSERERARLEFEQERERNAKLRQARWAAGVLGTLLVVAVATAYVAWRESARAEANFRLARNAVDQTLASAEVDPARMGADIPQMEEFRRELLEKTKAFYARFIEQKPSREDLYKENAYARFRLGHINRMLGRAADAAQEYAEAISEFDRLSADHPRTPEYREALADAYNYLGETFRPQPERAAEARAAYQRALATGDDLAREFPGQARYRRQLARTHYNRGIFRSMAAAPGDAQFAAAEADFRDAIRLLDPLAGDATDRTVAQELARAYNNLASLLSQDDHRLAEARRLYDRAVQLDRAVAQAEPENRQNRLELAKFENNLADLLRILGDPDEAAAHNAEALDLLDQLARPAPSLGVEIADAHNLRGRILASQGSPEALQEYTDALRMFERLAGPRSAHQPPEFHQRFGDLLVNLAEFGENGNDGARRLLTQAVDRYLQMADRSVATGATADARTAVETLAYVLPRLSESDRRAFVARFDELRGRLATLK